MSDTLLLTDPRKCPNCHAKFSRALNGNCPNCGTRLFSHTTHNFHAFESETGVGNWWAMHKEKGWVHRDHFMVENAKPLNKHYSLTLTDPPKNYGKSTTPEAVAVRGGKSKRLKSRHQDKP